MRWPLALGLATLAVIAACSRGGRRSPAPAAPAPAATPDSAKVALPDTLAIPPVIPADSARTPADSAKPAEPEKPGERCILDLENTPETRTQFIKDPISGKYTSYVGGGVVGHCRDQDITIIADSAETYDQNQLYYLLGNVKYREKRVSLDADKLTYFRADERLLAEGNVRTVTQDSSTMTGSRAEYMRAVRGIRLLPRMTATNRPTLQMFDKDSLGMKKGEPVILIADNIIADGDSLFTAWGRVELDRSDIKARGDSAFLDNTSQFSRLMKGPFIESKGQDTFTLKGRVIDLFGRTREVERILAIDSATAVSQDLTLTSDTIDLRVRENKLQRAVAFGPGGATAVSTDRTIVADSLDVLMPDQRIRELHAVGKAFAESDPDTSKISTSYRDWLRGDTIVARFDSLAASDTSSKPVIRELLASGAASSYYQIPNGNGEKDKPGVNYARGREIRVDFLESEVSTVTVIDQASGVYLEPQANDTSTVKPPPRRTPQGARPAPARVPVANPRP